MSNRTKIVLFSLCGLMAITSSVVAQQVASKDELAKQATDPTASLMSFQLNDWYTASFHDSDDTANQLVFRSAIPFQVGRRPNIFRITLPYATSTPSGASGLGDTTIFDLAVHNKAWGRWGLGVSGTIPTGENGLTLDKWTAGPSLGFINGTQPSFNWGLFAQTFFSFAGEADADDVGFINIQPIFAYQLGGGRTLALGNSAFVYDTEGSQWASLQLGMNYGQVVTWGGRKWRPNIEVDYDFKDDPGNPEWIIRLGLVLLVPAI